MLVKSAVTSTGSYLPENIVINSDLKQFPPQFLPIIEQKTGVKSRRFADDSQCTSDLAILAAQRCLGKLNFNPMDLDALILATSSPDRLQPATATRVQDRLGAAKAFAFDINSVCSGGIFALHIADSLIRAGRCTAILVLAAEIYSRFLNPKDITTFPYFGDGAGAVLLTAKSSGKSGILHSICKTDGAKADLIQVPAGGTMLPLARLKNPNDIYFKMVGKEVYEFAVSKGSEVINEILDLTNIDKEEIRYVITHQANYNIIKEISVRTGISREKFTVNLDKYGNTAAASVFISLDEVIEQKNPEHGDLILLVAFGGGLSWGATLLRI